VDEPAKAPIPLDKPGKPLGFKNYGSIGHLPGSRLGPGDHKVPDGQARICLEQTRDAHDRVIVTEKLDGSNVGVALKDGQLLALGRAGYLASQSPYEMHHLFAHWVRLNAERFRSCLQEGERVVGEWLALAHGTLYELPHEPFVVFDLFLTQQRYPYNDMLARCSPGNFVHPRLIHDGGAFSLEKLLPQLERSGHGALDAVEGAVYRVERKGQVDFLAKWVRPSKEDGRYLDRPENPCGNKWLWRP
jgi:hypothetical protein